MHISRTGVSVINQQETIAPPVQTTNDPTLEKGQRVVDDPGTPGSQMVTYRITKKNGKETARVQLSAKVLTPPQPAKVRVGTKEVSGDTVWDQLAQCESGGDWHSTRGYYDGGLQFDKSTWQAYGGGQYAPTADQASREQQIAIAEKVRAGRGGSYSAWPACSSKLGLS